jgi:hypothetical protein
MMEDERKFLGFFKDADGRRRIIPAGRGPLSFNIPTHAALRAFVYKRDGFACKKCGVVPPPAPENYNGRYAHYDLHIDHIKPRSKGGNHHPKNLQTLCFSCNSAKRDRIG